MIFFRTGIIAALLIGLGAPGGRMGAIRRTSVSTCAGFAEPTHSAQSRSRIRDPVAPTDATGPSPIDSRNGDSHNMAALPPEVRPRPARGRSCRRSFGARWSTTTARSRPARSSSIRRTPISISCSARARRCATGSASAARASPGPARRKCPGRRNGPDWNPPEQMIERQPYLPRFMAGGDGNPLGARALYLGDTIYRIHGTNQPSTIGTFVSSGCIRLTNEDITDLHSRVKVGTRVVVLPGRGQAAAVTTGLGSSGGTASRDKPPAVPSSSNMPARQLTPREIAARLRDIDAFGLAGPAACRCNSPGRYINGDLSSLASGARGTKHRAGETPGRVGSRHAEARRGRRGRRGSRACCPCVQGPSGLRRIRGIGASGRSTGVSRTVSVSRLGAAA